MTTLKATSKTAAITYAKEELRKELGVNRLPELFVKYQSATCGCGETQGVLIDAGKATKIIAICKHCANI